MTAPDIYIHIDRHRDLLCMHILWPSSCGTTASAGQVACVSNGGNSGSVPELPPPTVPCHAMPCRAVQLSCLHYCTVCHGHGCGHASYFNYDSRPRGWRAVSKSVSLSVCPSSLLQQPLGINALTKNRKPDMSLRTWHTAHGVAQQPHLLLTD